MFIIIILVLYRGTWNAPPFRRSLKSELFRLASHVRTHGLRQQAAAPWLQSPYSVQRKKSYTNARLFSLAGVRGIEPRFQVLETYALTAVLYPFADCR